jgi:hypothetical protein
MMAEGARAYVFFFSFKRKMRREIAPAQNFRFFSKKCMRGGPPTATSIKIEGKYSERYVRTVGGLKQMNPSLVIR